MADTRIIDLPDLLTISEGCFVAVDSDSDNTKRYDLSQVAATTDANVIASAAERAAQVATEEAERRIDAAIDAMGDISEQAVPVMSADVRGGAKIQPDSGLEITDTDNLQVRLALESEGDVRGGLAQVTAKGHAEQVSTTGKNLLTVTATTQTANGVTFTVNADGSVTCNGTATDVVVLYVVSSLPISDGTYTLSGCPSGGSTDTYRLDLYYDNSQQYIIDAGNSVTATLPSTAAACRIRIQSGYTCNNLTFYPQLELGSTATDYEPYTGGKPSPSPDYPQEIRVARGRNLYDGTRVAGYVSSDGSIVEPENYSHSNAIAVESGKSYVWSGLSGFNHVKRVHACDANGNWISSIAAMQADVGATYNIGFEVPAGVHYVMGTFNNSDSQLQLTVGSTSQPYVPYGHVGMDVQAVPTTYKTGYSITENGTESANSGFKITEMLVSGLSFVVTVANITSSVATRVHAYDSHGNWISQILYRSGPTTVLFSIPSNATRLRISQYKDASVIVTSTTPIPLPQRGWVAGLPDGTADVLTLDGAGKCEWEENTEEAVLDGSSDEHWARNAAIKCFYTNSLQSTSKRGPDLEVVNGLCSHFKASSISATTQNEEYFGGANQYGQFFFSYYAIDNEADWRTFLANSPMSLLYQLATPVTEDCGYCEDWPTDIPDSATVSIPELDAVGVKYFIDSAVTELARQWHDRIAYERTIATQDALASVAPIEHSTAESNHSIGELVTYQGVLYRVTAAIARGESITIGTNVTATTVAEQLAALQ